LLALLLGSCAVTARAAEEIRLEDVEIRALEGLPKVIYIVPWNDVPLDAGPVTLKSLIEEELAPIDIGVFRRQIRYEAIVTRPPETDAKPAATP
jgi:hypothetical protein